MSTVPHRPAFSPFPLALLAAAFALGVTLARLASPPLAPCVVCGVLLTAASVYALFRKRLALASAAVVCAFAFAGAALATVETKRVGENSVRRLYERGEVATGDPVELTGVVVRAPEDVPGGLLVTLRVERLRHGGAEREATGRVELFAVVRDARASESYAALELRRGARVRVMTTLARAERFRNPGVPTLSEFLERREVEALGSIKSHLLVERLDDERVFLPAFLLEEWRARLARSFEATFSAETAGVLKASLLGERHSLSRATAERFREGGTFHVLVISGMHISFVGGVVWLLSRRLVRGAARRWLASVAAVWVYAVFVGAEASVARAALMFTTVALAPVVGRRANALNALGGAALLLLAWRPASLFDPSFQLTFLSVLAIAALALPLLQGLKAIGEWRPTRATPYPPVCPRWWRALGETLFWSERNWRRELERSTHDYRLFKTPLAARLERWRVQRLLRYVFAAALVSVVVQLALLPLFVLYFHRLPLVAPLLNLFVGALMVVLSFAALAATALAQLGDALAAPLVRLAEASNWLMTHSVDPFAARGAASVRLPEYAGTASAVYGLYFAPLLVFMFALYRWKPVREAPTFNETRRGETKSAGRGGAEGAATKRVLVWACVAYVVLLALVVAHPLSAGRPDGRLRVDFLDVGQGDAALVTTPDGTTLLVDGGGRPRFGARTTGAGAWGIDGDEEGEPFERDARGVGELVVSEYLWWRGLSRVNYVVATHADADHVEGLGDVLRNFKVGAALVARAPAGDEEFGRFAEAASRAGVPVHLVGRGDAFSLGGATFEVLWPPRARDDADAARSSSRNADSVVLRVSFGRRSLLLTGDIEADAEARLVASAPDNLRCDALKVAHHGSRTSSTEAFAATARPAFAVIPVGLDSPYGHPHPEVVARWRAHGAQVLTTGERGTITVSTDGEDLKVETFVR